MSSGYGIAIETVNVTANIFIWTVTPTILDLTTVHHGWERGTWSPNPAEIFCVKENFSI